MHIKRISWQPVSIPLKAPLTASNLTLYKRISLLLFLETDANVTGVGEAPAPLTPTSSGINNLISKLSKIATPLVNKPLQNIEVERIARYDLSPEVKSIRFALDTAIQDCIGNAENLPMANLLGGIVRPVEVNAIIGSIQPKEIANLAEDAVSKGFRTLKVKVGAQSLEKDEGNLKQLRDVIGPTRHIRIDANGAWTEDIALKAIHRFAKYDIEYIEDPLALPNVLTLSKLKKESPIPIAVDDLITDLESSRALIEGSAADVLIIKPSRIGSFNDVLSIAKFTRTQRLKLVVTSSIETGIGLSSIIHLAAALDIDSACGLATSELLLHNLLRTPILSNQGIIRPANLPGLGISLDQTAIKHYSIGPQNQVSSYTLH